LMAYCRWGNKIFIRRRFKTQWPGGRAK